MDQAELAAFVRTRREARGLTQRELADLAGIDQATVSNLERGRTRLPTPGHRRRLAGALGVGHVDLLEEGGEVETGELEAWARGRRPDRWDADWWGMAVVARLREEPERSSRARLAVEVTRLTWDEAECVLRLVGCMPTAAGLKRREGLSDAEYREWRDGRDAVEAAIKRL